MMLLTDELLADHYAHIADKPFYPEIVSFMRSAPVIAMCWEGLDAADTVRRLVGITKAREADPGTIRGDYAMSIQCNVVHASESLEAAKEEVGRFFCDEELFSYEHCSRSFVYSVTDRS